MKSMAESGFWSSVPSLVLISLALQEGMSKDRSGRKDRTVGMVPACLCMDPSTATGEVQSCVIN